MAAMAAMEFYQLDLATFMRHRMVLPPTGGEINKTAPTVRYRERDDVREEKGGAPGEGVRVSESEGVHAVETRDAGAGEGAGEGGFGRKGGCGGDESYDSDGDDNEDDFRPKRALDVSGDPDWSLSGPPLSAEEYLRRVRWEARRCPNVVRAAGIGSGSGSPSSSQESGQKIPVASALRSSVIMSTMPPSKVPPAPKHTVPDARWERSLINNFSELRLKIASAMGENAVVSDGGKFSEAASTSGAVEISGPNREAHGKLKTLPGVRDPDAWRRFCIGEDPNPPSVELLCRLGETRASIVLRHAVSWLEDDCSESGAGPRGKGTDGSATGPPHYSCPLSKQLCMWIFSLCAAAGKPLDADTCASLRSLLRHCCRLRADVPEAGLVDPVETAGDDRKHALARLNMLITIAGKYFSQGADLDFDHHLKTDDFREAHG